MSETEVSNLARRVRDIRESKAMTQQQLAVAAGLSLSLVSAIEQGTRGDPKMSTVAALARALGVDVAELFRGPTPAKARKGK